MNLLDCDPHGEPWPVIDAFLTSDRPRAARLVIVVNDGLRAKVRIGGGWDVKSLKGMVAKYGNGLQDIYLDVCKELLQEKAALAGYRLDRFWGYYAGHLGQMTHYLGVLEQ